MSRYVIGMFFSPCFHMGKPGCGSRSLKTRLTVNSKAWRVKVCLLFGSETAPFYYVLIVTVLQVTDRPLSGHGPHDLITGEARGRKHVE
jgi:hypothetical protein